MAVCALCSASATWGGWTDTRIVPHGAVLNFAARLYTYVTLVVKEGPAGITLESLDTDERCSFQDTRRMEYNGVLDLLKAAVANSGLETRRSRTVLHPPSGDASGAARTLPRPADSARRPRLGVAANAAQSAYNHRRHLPHEVARETQILEESDLKLECGVKDQFASAHGWVNFMEVEYPQARVFPIPLTDSVRCELEERFVLVYTGKSHFSSGMHQKVIAEADRHRDNFDRLARAAVAGKEALLSGDLEAFAVAMNANWEGAKRTASGHHHAGDRKHCTYAAEQEGAIGFKANAARRRRHRYHPGQAAIISRACAGSPRTWA